VLRCCARWADAFVGIDVFGASAPGNTCMDKFGFNVPNVVRCAQLPLSLSLPLLRP
jgi:transketolase